MFDTFWCEFVIFFLDVDFSLFVILYENSIRAVNEMTCATHESHHRLLTISQYETYYVCALEHSHSLSFHEPLMFIICYLCENIYGVVVVFFTIFFFCFIPFLDSNCAFPFHFPSLLPDEV